LVGDAEAVLVPVQVLLEAVFEAVHAPALALDQVSVLDLPAVTVVRLADSDTETVGTVGVGGDVLDEMPPLQALRTTKLATPKDVAILKPDIAHPTRFVKPEPYFGRVFVSFIIRRARRHARQMANGMRHSSWGNTWGKIVRTVDGSTSGTTAITNRSVGFRPVTEKNGEAQTLPPRHYWRRLRLVFHSMLFGMREIEVKQRH
jgi:hypothetical protein